MVGRLVEQQDFGLFEQQAAQRNSTALAARQAVDGPVAWRATQGFHRDLELVVECPAVDRIDFFLKRAHFLEQFVEIGFGGWLAHLG